MNEVGIKKRQILLEDAVLRLLWAINENGIVVDNTSNGLATEATAAIMQNSLEILESTVNSNNEIDSNLRYSNADVTNANPVPVKVMSTGGDVTITAGNINVRFSHVDEGGGVGYDSCRIGDGTTLVGVTTSNELKVSDVSNTNPLDKFAIARTDVTGVVNYYGFLDKDGNWYIMRETVATGVYDYYYSLFAIPFTGASGWSNRAAITYVEFNVAF